MMQSTLQRSAKPLHVAIIMDGNGRWAEQRGQARQAGHLAGALAVRRTVEAAVQFGVGTLTLHAFSSDNWKRPAAETAGLMALFLRYLRDQTARCMQTGVRVSVVGRRDRLDPGLLRAIAATEASTLHGKALHLRLAVDYSARHSLLQAARLFRESADNNSVTFARCLAAAAHESALTPNVDLLIRTGGEHRFSDLFGWECAYAELIFTPLMWPDFDGDSLQRAIAEFRRRERRFGALPAPLSRTDSAPRPSPLHPGSSLSLPSVL